MWFCVDSGAFVSPGPEGGRSVPDKPALLSSGLLPVSLGVRRPASLGQVQGGQFAAHAVADASALCVPQQSAAADREPAHTQSSDEGQRYPGTPRVP